MSVNTGHNSEIINANYPPNISDKERNERAFTSSREQQQVTCGRVPSLSSSHDSSDKSCSAGGPGDPLCFPIFRWSLILVGLVMLGLVLVVLGQLVADWAAGRHQHPATTRTEGPAPGGNHTRILLIQDLIDR